MNLLSATLILTTPAIILLIGCVLCNATIWYYIIMWFVGLVFGVIALSLIIELKKLKNE